jgi:hypothetical protein
MFALFAGERNWLTMDQPRTPFPVPVVGALGWQAFTCLTRAAECAIVLLPPADGVAARRLIADVRSLRRDRPYVPLVLVTAGAHAAELFGLGEVVQAPVEAVRLWPACQRACTRALLDETRDAFRRRGEPRRLWRALAAACDMAMPASSVGALASAAGCHRRTLWHHWRSRSPLAPTLDLDDVLDRLVLLRACASRRRGVTWELVALRLGVRRRMLSRIAARVAGLTLRDLSPDALPRVRAAFRQEVLTPLAIEVGPRR